MISTSNFDWGEYIVKCSIAQFQQFHNPLDTKIYPYDSDYAAPLLHMAILNRRDDIALHILRTNHSIELVDSKNYSPLELSIRVNNLFLIEILLQRGANPYRKNPVLPVILAFEMQHIEAFNIIEGYINNLGKHLLYWKYLAHRFSIGRGGAEISIWPVTMGLEYHWDLYMFPRFQLLVRTFLSQSNFFPPNWDFFLNRRIQAVMDNQDPKIIKKKISIPNHTLSCAISENFFILMDREKRNFYLYTTKYDRRQLVETMRKLTGTPKEVDEYIKGEIFFDLKLQLIKEIPAKGAKGNFCTWLNVKPLLEGITILILLEDSTPLDIALLYGRALRRNFTLFDKTEALNKLQGISHLSIHHEMNKSYFRTLTRVNMFNVRNPLPTLKP